MFRRIPDEVILRVCDMSPRTVQHLKIEEAFKINDEILEYMEESANDQ